MPTVTPSRGLVRIPSGKLYVLAIGINDYTTDQHWPPLHNAVGDAQAFVDVLRNHYDWRPEAAEYIHLENQQATRSGIMRAFKQLSEPGFLTAQDSLLIYYAGHGFLDNNESGYWVPVNGEYGDESTYVSNDEIKGFVKNLKCRHVLLISDSCFSGAMLTEGTRGSRMVAQKLVQLPSRWAICSGRHNEEVADGPRGQHSPFAEALIYILTHPVEEAITAEYLGMAIKDQTANNYQYQLPDCGPIFGVGDKRGQFVFWPNGRAPKEAEAAPESILVEEARTESDTVDTSIVPTTDYSTKMPMTLDILKSQVSRALMNDEVKTALLLLQEHLNASSRNQDTIILLFAQFNRLRKREMQGVVTDTNAQVERNRISYSITSLLDDIEEEDLI